MRPLLPCLFPISLIAQQAPNYATQLVNPFIGTGGHGHTFPGACVPNGLVQLSPDTRPDGTFDWDGCGGYHYSDSIIYGFSHTHLSGTGVADLCDVLLMPKTGSMGGVFTGSIGQRFDRGSEMANAGYYKVDLLGASRNSTASSSSVRVPTATDRITVELTATRRTGVHRYTFSPDAEAEVRIDLLHRDKLLSGGMEQLSATEVTGERRSSSWAKDQRLFFCVRFSSPITNYQQLLSNPMPDAVSYSFGKLKEPLIVKVGISAVSIEGARANLDAEVHNIGTQQSKVAMSTEELLVGSISPANAAPSTRSDASA